jgi:hypothetical protein
VSKSSPLVVRLLKGFGMFWWDFLVGDTPELFVAALVIIGVAAWISEALDANTTAVVVLPALVVAALAISVRRVVSATRRK